MICINCGSELAQGAKFCMSCGTPVPATEPASTEQDAQASQAPQVPIEPTVAPAVEPATEQATEQVAQQATTEQSTQAAAPQAEQSIAEQATQVMPSQELPAQSASAVPTYSAAEQAAGMAYGQPNNPYQQPYGQYGYMEPGQPGQPGGQPWQPGQAQYGQPYQAGMPAGEQPKKKKSVGVIILIVVLSLVVIGGLGVGGYLIYDNFFNKPDDKKTESTEEPGTEEPSNDKPATETPDIDGPDSPSGNNNGNKGGTNNGGSTTNNGGTSTTQAGEIVLIDNRDIKITVDMSSAGEESISGYLEYEATVQNKTDKSIGIYASSTKDIDGLKSGSYISIYPSYETYSENNDYVSFSANKTSTATVWISNYTGSEASLSGLEGELSIYDAETYDDLGEYTFTIK